MINDFDDSIVCKKSSKILKAHILTQPRITFKLKRKKKGGVDKNNL